MRFSFSLFFYFFVFSTSFGQSEKNKVSKFYQDYSEYFELPRESLYLHLNKSSYLRGENLWFSGYAYDRQTGKLSPKVRNVELRLYDEKGIMLQKKLYLSIDGKFNGQIAIDSTFNDGAYYLKAETNWMKNFNEDYAHLQQFEIIGSSQTNTKQTLKAYDLQILPEGGHSVIDCEGVLGLKLINEQGLGVEFEAELLDNEVPIFNFKSNRFGLARLDLKPEPDKVYKIKVKLPNGKTIIKTVDNIKTYGYDLRVNNIIPGQTQIYVSSHLSSSSQYNNRQVKLLVHQEGKRFEIPIEFSKDKTSIAKVINKQQLFYGVNTITLLVDDEPVAERLIFIRKNSINNKKDIDISVENFKNDTLTLNLALPNYSEKAHLSISVLPENTISYIKNQNITSALLLEPFVNGYIENKPYYFSNPNRIVDYNLDLLLLTQGWSQYKWNNIFNKPPNEIYKRKDGLTQNVNFNGKIPDDVDKLLIYSTIYNKEQVFALSVDQTLKLKNRYPLIGEKMEFSFINKNKDFIRPNVVVGTELQLNNDKLNNKDLLPPLSNLRQLKLELDNNRLYANFLEGELLDEVIVKASKEKEDKIQKNFASNFKDNTIKVDEEMATTYPLLSDYLSYRGYLVTDNTSNFSIRNLTRTSINGSNTPVVYLNGVQLNDLSILGGSRTADYEEIYIDKTGYGGGVQGATGIIRLQSRKTALFTNENSAKTELPYAQFEIKKGFEPPKQFYMPEYAFFLTDSFQQVGTLAWFPDVVIEPNKNTKLNIFDTELYKFKLFIEGIGEDGSIINIEKIIKRN
ncbi:hypothetical protein [Flavobacterium sp. CS20]|uniref:hypothetical protein n=1 Tax=Flavobacterium sp. CS20 TaxID=2775246 RepID=UPI001B3A37BA|nr:hypothetical protein [Flavobacterium sp. CS20]QTY27008.1 hypothetical protein IGB25_14395 [Flavobacterium sp. CS20]